MSAIINFAPQCEGDTLEQRIFAVKRTVLNVLQDLTDASGVFEVYRKGGDRIWLSQSIEILDGENCLFRIPEIKNPGLTPYDYLWKITLTYSDGDVKTYLNGTLPIVKFNSENSCLKQ